MIPAELVVLAVALAFWAGWLLRGDHDEKKRIATKINPMFDRSYYDT